MRESAIERPVCKFAKDHGVLAMKLAGPGQRGQPDRMFLKDGRVLFIEFKAPGKKPTPLQYWWSRRLAKHGMTWYWADSYEGAVELIRKHLL